MSNARRYSKIQFSTTGAATNYYKFLSASMKYFSFFRKLFYFYKYVLRYHTNSVSFKRDLKNEDNFANTDRAVRIGGLEIGAGGGGGERFLSKTGTRTGSGVGLATGGITISGIGCSSTGTASSPPQSELGSKSISR